MARWFIGETILKIKEINKKIYDKSDKDINNLYEEGRKISLEHYIDEKILLKTGLMKDRLRKVGVPWENLKKIDKKEDEIKKLEGYWNDLSDRGTHATQNSNENPLKTEDLNKIIAFLKS